MKIRLEDQRGRPVRDLRVSVTDRCNFRCTYCMPKETFGQGFRFMPHAELLSFEEIARVASILVDRGVGKIRITGGEPLLRREVEKLVALLAALPGRPDLTLTTNGSLLPRKAGALRDAGLGRITVSLDSLDDAAFRAMNDVAFPVAKVLEGIEAAREAGNDPIKVNMVVKRGVNEASVLPMVRRFRGTGVVLRFIEFMDVGSTNGWRLEDVVSARAILDAVGEEFPIDPVEPSYAGEVARRYRYRDGAGEIGIIASVTEPFCGGCTRLRLSSDGRLFTCLFATEGFDLRSRLRTGVSDEEIAASLDGIWTAREDRYSELRTSETPETDRKRVEMSRIGG